MFIHIIIIYHFFIKDSDISLPALESSSQATIRLKELVKDVSSKLRLFRFMNIVQFSQFINQAI